MDKYKDIERSIIKKYRKEIWGRFVKGVKDYSLINDNDKIMVCISGGKDSFLMAKCIQELQKHSDVKFEAKYVVMNPGYNELNSEMIEKNAKLLNIEIEVFNSNIFDIVSEIEKSPCYLCARMRRGHLYNKAAELGCNKIALGHHFNDVIETTLLSILYGSEVKTMLPKLHSDNFEGIDLIRPMYFVREDDVISWTKYNELTFINCACRFTENCSISSDDENETSKRKEIKKLIASLKNKNPNIEWNIFKSMENVNINCVLGYKLKDKKHTFLEAFDEKED